MEIYEQVYIRYWSKEAIHKNISSMTLYIMYNKSFFFNYVGVHKKILNIHFSKTGYN